MTKNVKVSEENHKRLQKMGDIGTSMNSAISRLLDFWDSEHKGVRGGKTK